METQSPSQGINDKERMKALGREEVEHETEGKVYSATEEAQAMLDYRDKEIKKCYKTILKFVSDHPNVDSLMNSLDEYHQGRGDYRPFMQAVNKLANEVKERAQIKKKELREDIVNY